MCFVAQVVVLARLSKKMNYFSISATKTPSTFGVCVFFWRTRTARHAMSKRARGSTRKTHISYSRAADACRRMPQKNGSVLVCLWLTKLLAQFATHTHTLFVICELNTMWAFVLKQPRNTTIWQIISRMAYTAHKYIYRLTWMFLIWQKVHQALPCVANTRKAHLTYMYYILVLYSIVQHFWVYDGRRIGWERCNCISAHNFEIDLHMSHIWRECLSLFNVLGIYLSCDYILILT